MNQRACSDDTPRTNLSLRHHGGAYSYQNSLLNTHIAAQAHPRRNMDVISNAIVMIHDAARIEDDVRTNNASRIDHRARADHAPRSNQHIWSDDRARMPYNRELCSVMRHHLE